MKHNYSRYWYTLIVIFSVFILSLMSWIQFFSVKVLKNEEDNGINIEPGLLGTIKYAYHSTVDFFDANWNVYNEKTFSNIDSVLSYYLIKDFDSIQVLAGENNWLFYKGAVDCNPIADFEGTNQFTNLEMNEILDKTLTIQDYLIDKDIKFSLLIPPNKENIYYEYMPKDYSYSNSSRTDELVKYLYDNGVNVISPKEELLKYHNDLQLYYKYDTHWNQLGAYIGVKNVLNSWNECIPSINDKKILKTNLKGQYHYCAEDDLAKMVGMLNYFDDEIEYSINEDYSIKWEEFEEEQNSNQISLFKNVNAANKKKLLLVGDSFRTAMIPSLVEEYSEVYVVHRSYFNKEMIEKINPEYFILEYVERFSGELKYVDSLFN